MIRDRHDPPRPRRCCGKRIDISCHRTGQNPSPSGTPCWGPSRTVDTADTTKTIVCISSRQIARARGSDPHLKRGEHPSSGFRDDHLGAELMEFLPERLRLQSDAGAEQRRMERPLRARARTRPLHGCGPARILPRMMVTVMTIVVVAVVARFHRGGRGYRIRRVNRRYSGLHRMIGTARSLYSSGALQTSWKENSSQRTSERKNVCFSIRVPLYRASENIAKHAVN